MSAALTEAYEEALKLSEEEQERIAALVRERIEQARVVQAVREALEEVEAGRAIPLDEYKQRVRERYGLSG